MRSHASWIDGTRGHVFEIAEALRLPLRRPRGSSSGWIGRCPVCGAERRHTKSHDRRGAIGVRPDGSGWHCFQCDTSGDALGLVTYELCGRPYRELDDAGKAEVRAWCLQWQGLPDDVAQRGRNAAWSASPPRPRREPLMRRSEQPKPEPAPERAYPPQDELAEFWSQCRRVDEPGTALAEWLRLRRLDPQTIADGDFARAIPAKGDYRLPNWACSGRGPSERTWRANGYHLIAPQFDANGVMCSVIARNVLSALPEAERREICRFSDQLPKSLPPRGHKRAGLVLLCHVALHLFRRRELPKWSPWRYRAGPRIECCEGEKKFLMRALSDEANECAPLVIGVESGSWTPEIAARIPDGSELVILTDQNEAGAKYATTIVRTLAERILTGALRIELRPEFDLSTNRYGELIVQLKDGVAA